MNKHDASQQQLTGVNLLRNARYNKGTAFTEDERKKYKLEGLLLPVIENIHIQLKLGSSQLTV